MESASTGFWRRVIRNARKKAIANNLGRSLMEFSVNLKNCSHYEINEVISQIPEN
jgi:hypothetical protein